MATFPHTRTPHSTRHSPHILHFNQSHHVWNCNIQHRTTFHIHWRHFAPNRSTTSRHTIPHHAINRSPHSDINYTSHCPTAHIALSQTTPHIHHAFYITAMFNKLSNHYGHTTRYIPQPDFASQHTTIPRRTMFHNTISVTLHDFTCSPYSTLHFIPHRSHIRMNKAQHPTSGIAKQIGPHHTMATTVAMWCVTDLVVLNVWNDVRCMVYYAGNVTVGCEILSICGGEMWNV